MSRLIERGWLAAAVLGSALAGARPACAQDDLTFERALELCGQWLNGERAPEDFAIEGWLTYQANEQVVLTMRTGVSADAPVGAWSMRLGAAPYAYGDTRDCLFLWSLPEADDWLRRGAQALAAAGYAGEAPQSSKAGTVTWTQRTTGGAFTADLTVAITPYAHTLSGAVGLAPSGPNVVRVRMRVALEQPGADRSRDD